MIRNPNNEEHRAEVRRLYSDEKKSSIQIAGLIGRSKYWVLTQLRDMAIVRPLKQAFAISALHQAAIHRKGPECPRWKGGRKISGGGYVAIMRPEHPNADPAGYVLEHRLVMEGVLGRLLRPDEDIHHLNEVKSDNRIENLGLLSRSAHMSHHATLRHRAGTGRFGVAA